MRIEQPISISTGGTVATGKSLIVTTADLLTVGGIIIPQTLPIFVTLNALSVSSSLFVADAAYQIISCKAVWGVAGGLAAVLNVEKLTGTTAPGSGTALLSSNIDLTATANTVVSGTLTAVTADLQLAAGDRIGVKLGGTLTGLVGCNLVITVKRI